MSNNLSQILQHWKQLDLSSLQRELDEKAADLANRQDESESSRKRLVDLSREFKKNTDEDTRKVVTPVLKCFQSEVDSLSKRSKAAEAAFLSLYKKVIESPDPVPVLECCVQAQKKLSKLQDSEIENQNLKETLQQYNQEFAEVKNQEVIIRQLKEKIKSLEEQSDTIVKTKLAEKEHILSKSFDDKERRLLINEQILQSRMHEAESRAESLENSLVAVQRELYALKSHSDELGAARTSEIDLILSDLEKATLRAAVAERELQIIREERPDAMADDSSTSSDIQHQQKSVDNDIELAVKDRQVSQLLDEITQFKVKAEAEILEKSQQFEVAKRSLLEKNIQVSTLEEKLSAHGDYDEIKRELNMLKSMYLGEQVPATDAPSPFVDSNNLELLLLDKTKSLQAEKTGLMGRNRELENQRSKLARDRVSDIINSLATNRREKTTTAAPPVENGSPSTLNNVVDRMACLIGSEIVSSYGTRPACTSNRVIGSIDQKLMDSDAQRSKDEARDKLNRKRSANAVLQRAKRARTRARQHTNQKTSPSNAAAVRHMLLCKGAAAGETNTCFVSSGLPATPSFADIDDALDSGVPREVVEGIAIQHLQQILNATLSQQPLPAPGAKVLDTVAVAAQCRAVLNEHNIGQRLLARCVLGQSQGAVSELLAKPRPWWRLTDRCRESFVRINAWLQDQSSVDVLRMVSPKRMCIGVRERHARHSDNPETKRRVQRILADVHAARKRALQEASAAGTETERSAKRNNGCQDQSALLPQLHIATSTPKVLPHAKPAALSATTPKLSPQPNSLQMAQLMRRESHDKRAPRIRSRQPSNRYRHDDIPKEMIYQIYQRELTKLREQQNCFYKVVQPILDQTTSASATSHTESDACEADAPPTVDHLFTETLDGHADMCSSTSQTCFVMPTTPTAAFPPASNQSSSPDVPKAPPDHAPRNRRKSVHVSRISPSRLSAVAASFADEADEQQLHSCNGGAKTVACGEQQGSLADDSDALLNASIASILEAAATSNCATPSKGTTARPALPPVTEEQFVKYNPLNTAALVREVKDYLCSHCISQRVFGEKVLGLSQGSVSDLLARPKPWASLTQKGREPFVRMRAFMDDPDAWRLLILKRGADKIVRTCRNDSQDEIAADDAQGGPPVASPEEEELPPKLFKLSSPDMQQKADDSTCAAGSSGSFSISNINEQFLGLAVSVDEVQRKQSELDQTGAQLDIPSIVRQVRECLQKHNVGQRSFGLAVLGMSQGAVSDLLSKSKGWSQLTFKGREAFVRMHVWLQDEHNIDKVLRFKALRATLMTAHQQEKRAGESVPAKSKAAETVGREPAVNIIASVVRDVAQQREACNKLDAETLAHMKKQRCTLDDEKKRLLQAVFDKDIYPPQPVLRELARKLDVTGRTITNWFHNRRMRMRAREQRRLRLLAQQAAATTPAAAAQETNLKSDLHNLLLVLQQHSTDEAEAAPPDSQQGPRSRSTVIDRLASGLCKPDAHLWEPEEQLQQRSAALRRFEANVGDSDDALGVDWQF